MAVPFRNAVLEFGDARLEASNREGAFVVESVTGWWGGVGVKGDRTARLGHGDFGAPNQRTGRALTLNLIWVGDSADRDSVNRRLSGLFDDGQEGTLTCTTGVGTLTAEQVTLDGEIGVAEVGTQAVRFQVPLHAADPCLYGPWRETTLRPIGAGVGLVYPVLSPVGGGSVVSYGAGVEAADPIWNRGNTLAWPRFRVVAAAPGGFAVSLAGRTVTYPWATFPDMPVVVDMAGALTVSGVDQSHMLGSRGWAHLEAESVGQPRFDLLQGGHGFCVVSSRDTYM